MCNKLPVITCQPEKATQFLQSSRCWPFTNRLDFGFVCGHAITRNHMDQVGDSLLHEGTLQQLNLPMIMLQDTEDSRKVLDMVSECRVVDWNLVEEDESKFSQDRCQQCIHGMQKGCWSSSKSKHHDLEIVVTVV
jgi:hypothetical protein